MSKLRLVVKLVVGKHLARAAAAVCRDAVEIVDWQLSIRSCELEVHVGVSQVKIGDLLTRFSLQDKEKISE